jgi:hypothetical protein
MRSSFYYWNFLYPQNQQRRNVESIETNLRNGLYTNEITGLTQKQKLDNQLALVSKASTSLQHVKLGGFNVWASLMGLAAYHFVTIMRTKVLFHEMGKGAILHAGICIGMGVTTGLLIGQLFSYDMILYIKWKQASRQVQYYQREVSKHMKH